MIVYSMFFKRPVGMKFFWTLSQKFQGALIRAAGGKEIKGKRNEATSSLISTRAVLFLFILMVFVFM